MTVASAPELREAFGPRLRLDVPLARYTSSRIGGNADGLIEVRSSLELADAVRKLWALEKPYLILGAGSNVLVSDRGCRAVVLINRAKKVEFGAAGAVPSLVRSESGAAIGLVARQCVQRGWSGLEWAVAVPGTVGGAIVGNAGASGGDIARSLHLAEILQHPGWGKVSEGDGGPPDSSIARFSPVELGFTYRSSRLKRERGWGVVLWAEFRMQPGGRAEIRRRAEDSVAQRKRTQPPGASLGSMFKNPTGDFAGRLIEEAGLKGKRLGGVEISRVHANFFVNLGGAKAEDVLRLMEETQAEVQRRSGIELEPEIEFVGAWESIPFGGPGG
ncbi:MAG: UDP-N-acetylmuramate dehydrogenase [Anaerolineales bacterium]|jgi:UDP-N-acetylmuramate dehydrogenase